MCGPFASFGIVNVAWAADCPRRRVAAMLNAAAARKRRRLIAFIRISSPSLPSLILFEVEIGQIHVAAGQDVDGENIPPLAKADLEELRSQVPVVPLTPSHGVCRVICCWDLQWSCCFFSIDVDRDRSATIRGVKKIG